MNSLSSSSYRRQSVGFLKKLKLVTLSHESVHRNDYDFSEDIDISLNEIDSKFAGSYKDTLIFTFNPLDTRTIILDCNGGSSSNKTIIKYTVRDGSTYGELPTPLLEKVIHLLAGRMRRTTPFIPRALCSLKQKDLQAPGYFSTKPVQVSENDSDLSEIKAK